MFSLRVEGDFRHEVFARNVLPVRQLSVCSDGDKRNECDKDFYVVHCMFFLLTFNSACKVRKRHHPAGRTTG